MSKRVFLVALIVATVASLVMIQFDLLGGNRTVTSAHLPKLTPASATPELICSNEACFSSESSLTPMPMPNPYPGNSAHYYEPELDRHCGAPTYVVQDGDTLWDIAERFSGDPTTWVHICTTHPEDPAAIMPGEIVSFC